MAVTTGLSRDDTQAITYKLGFNVRF